MKKIVMLLMATAVCGLLSAQIVSIPDANFKTILTTKTCADFDGDGVLDGDVDTNDDGEIQMFEAESVLELKLKGFLNDAGEKMYLSNTDGIGSFNSVKKIEIDFLSISEQNGRLNLGMNFKDLQDLHINIFYSIDNVPVNFLLGQAANLKNFTIIKDNNVVESSGIVSGEFDLTGFPNIENINFSDFYFETLNFSSNQKLKNLLLKKSNDILGQKNTKLSLGVCQELERLNLLGVISLDEEYEQIDLSKSTKLEELVINVANLKRLILKNNNVLSSEKLNFTNCNELEFICADEDEVQMIKNKANEYGYKNLLVSSDCNADSEEIVNIPDQVLKKSLTSTVCADFDGDGVFDGDVDTNDDGEIQVSEAKAVIGLLAQGPQNSTDYPIYDLKGIERFVNIETLNVEVLSAKNFNLIENIKLKKIVVRVFRFNSGGGWQKNILNVGKNENLKHLEFLAETGLDGMEIEGDLDFTNYPNLEYLRLLNTKFEANLDFSSNNKLKTIIYNHDNESYDYPVQSKFVKFGAHPDLETVFINRLKLDSNSKEINLVNSPKINNVVLKSLDSLKIIKLRNESVLQSENLDFSNNKDLEFICGDDEEIVMLRDKVKEYGYSNCDVSANCNAGDNIPDNAFRYYLRTQICADFDGDGTYDADVDINNDGQIQLSEAEAVVGLKIESTDSKFIKNIKGIKLFNALKDLKISVLSEVEPSTYDLSQNSDLENLDLYLAYGDEKLNNPEFIFGDKPSLKSFKAYYNGVSMSGYQFENVNFSLMPNLKQFTLNGGVSIPKIDFTSNEKLKGIFINWTTDSSSEFLLGSQPLLETFVFKNYRGSSDVDNELDFSMSPSLKMLEINGEGLIGLNLKNGSKIAVSNLKLSGSTNLSFICVDKIEESEIIEEMKIHLPNCKVTSYCSFNPEEDYFTVTGKGSIDSNKNGCDDNDSLYPAMKFVISGDVDGEYISNATGNFEMPFEEGSYTITPQLENTDYYTVSPSSITVNFPADGENVLQDFCITPTNVTLNDLEVSIFPLGRVKPDAQTQYKIVYINKGNTSVSGEVKLTFNENFMSLVSASPVADSQIPNKLSWSYTNLLPYEQREIVLDIAINSSTDINFPVEAGERLVFDAFVTPNDNDNDNNADNNEFKLVQYVVSEKDFNNSVCLEGVSIEEEQVGDYVHYMVRFKNTGGAQVQNVVVKNQVDDNLSVSTLIPLKGSHDYITTTNGDNVEFIFKDINLLPSLVDGSNEGYVAFKVKTKPNLKIGDSFINKANIYFDNQSPVAIISPVTKVGGTLSVSNAVVDNIRLYPNPVSNQLNISSKKDILSVRLLDITGKELQTTNAINAKNTTLNLSHLKQGVYFVNVMTKNGISTHKVVKK